MYEEKNGRFVCKHKSPDLVGVTLPIVEAYNSSTHSRDIKNGTFDVSALIKCMEIYAIPDDYQHITLQIMSEFEAEVLEKLAPLKK